MATLGKTTTPNTGSFGFNAFSSHPQVAMSFTVPAGGGLFDSVSFCAAGATTLAIHGVIWDNSGNVLAFGPGVNTSGGHASGDGDETWFTDTFSSPVFIAGGTQVYIGWQRDTTSAVTVYWAYNGNDHSPNAEWNGNSGATGQTFSGHSLMNGTGAVAAYATYTPALLKVRRSGSWTTPTVVKVRRSGAWVAASGVYVRRSNAWVRIF